MSSMCLSWIDTPCSRYTFWTSSTKYCCVSRTPRMSSSSFGSRGPSTNGSPARTSWPSTIARRAMVGTVCVSSSPSSPTTTISRPRPSSSPMRTTPVLVARVALPLGWRASNNSTTRGKPPAISLPATPPVWNVRMVNCVPGSPIDWAAITPTASPTSIILPEASDPP